MAFTTTTSRFELPCQYPTCNSIEFRGNLVASKALTWQLVLNASFVLKEHCLCVLISVEATAVATDNHHETKLVHASCKLSAGQCSDACSSETCNPSKNHRMSTLKALPLSHDSRLNLEWSLAINSAKRNVSVEVTLYTFANVEPSAPHPVTKNLKAMLYTGELSDVTFVVEGEHIPAHSAILGAASDVFKAMFQHDTEDKRTGRITVEDVDPVIFREMLRCVYTGSEPLWEDGEYAEPFLISLIFLAEKYLLLPLYKHCRHRLRSTFSPDNAVVRLRAVSAISPSMLPVLAAPIKQHLAEIITSKSWMAFVEEDPASAARTLFDAMKM